MLLNLKYLFFFCISRQRGLGESTVSNTADWAHQHLSAVLSETGLRHAWILCSSLAELGQALSHHTYLVQSPYPLEQATHKRRRSSPASAGTPFPVLPPSLFRTFENLARHWVFVRVRQG